MNLDREIIADAYTSTEALDTLVELCDSFGPRFAGSNAERGAGEFVLQRLRGTALANVHAESVSYRGWTSSGRARLAAVSPRKKSLDCIELPYSPSTRARGLEAEVIDLGDGTPEDFDHCKRAIRGRIVLVTSDTPPTSKRWIHRAEKFGRAVKAGAAGFIYANHYDGLLPATGCLRFGRQAEIPGVAIAKETRAELLRLKSDGPLTVNIITTGRTKAATSSNIIGEIRGATHPDELIIVGGHYDTHSLCEGASDNGTGVVTVIEAARLLAPHAARIERTIRFCAFAAEEIGLVGSHGYVLRHRREMARVRFMFNVDCIPDDRRKGLTVHGRPRMRAWAGQLGREMSYDLPFADKVTPYSDNHPFYLAGVPCATLGNAAKAPSGRGWGHTAADTVDKISLRDMQEAGEITARLLHRIANARTWPWKRMPAAQIRRQLADGGYTAIASLER